MRHPSSVASMLLVLATVALTGCAFTSVVDEPPTATDRPADQGDGGPAPSDQPSEVPVRPGIASDPIELSFTGLGELQLGEPASQSDLVAWDDDFCAFPDSSVANPGRWIAVGEFGPDEREPFSVATDPDGLVAAIELRSDVLATDRGIRLGSAAVDFESAYPEQTLFETGYASTAHHAVSGDAMIIVEIARESPGSDNWSDEETDTVIGIALDHVETGVAIGTRANSDNVVGGCF